ncbi:hypothetical protein HYX00_00750 [Candidatus Woesearchaeota archaeon]|nr:hypothetical protein [Candidatus Woesearchaeota archaeon]
MRERIVDFNRFPNLPYKNTDIISPVRINEDQAVPPNLDGVDLEGRSHLLYVRVRTPKGEEELFVRPYSGVDERHAIAELRKSGVTAVLDHNKDYFVEERIEIPSTDKALEGRVTFLDATARLFGKALYQIHSRGISYNGEFENHVFADDIRGEVKITNFSKAKAMSGMCLLMEDAIKALQYIESLLPPTANQTQSKRKQQKKQEDGLFRAVKAFRDEYSKDEMEHIFKGAVQYAFYYLDSKSPLVKVLKRLGYN